MVDAKLIAMMMLMASCIYVGIGTYGGTDAAGNAIVLMEGVKWSHESEDGGTGDICMQGANFQAHTYKNDNIFVTEIVGGKSYTYQMQNADVLRAQVGAGPPADLGYDAFAETDWIDELAGAKYNCKVEDAPEIVNFAASANGDGTYKVGGWDVTVDSFNNPTTLRNAEDDWSLTITGVSSCADAVVVGCDPAGPEGSDGPPESATLRRRLTEVRRDEGTRILREGARTGRLLGAWTDLQAWASDTTWCGAGTDMNSPCPGTTGGDVEGDFACHRHDHGKKSNGIIGGMAVRLGCDIDRGLAERTSNGAAQAVFGSWGLAQTWGCYDHGAYSCWNWASKWWGGYWRHGNYCSGEHTHYGPWRYSSYSHSYGWKSQSRCATSLPWGAGQM